MKITDMTQVITQPSVSIVVPLYNEEECVLPLVARVHECLQSYPYEWELILVDDGSSDCTVAEIHKAISLWGRHVHLLELARNFKQTAAMQAGIDAATGNIIVTMDGDLQNDPIDIPKMVEKLLTEDLDLVAGWREKRQDGFLLRKIPSQIANRLIRHVTGVHLHDYGCSLKVFRAETLRRIRLFGEMHRFIPAWLSTVTSPKRIAEIPVCHHPRTRGQSKYGLSRTFRVVLDLLAVYFHMRFRDRPGHFFGGVGLILSSIGGLILSYLLILKLFGESIGTRPLLLTGIVTLLVGVHCILTGVLAETLARVYFAHDAGRSYTLRYSSKEAEGVTA